MSGGRTNCPEGRPPREVATKPRVVALIALLGAALFSAPHTLAQFSQQGPKLVGAGALGIPQQGGAVAVSADGNTAIVGGPYSDGWTGAAWIWTRSAGGSWTQQGPKLTGSGVAGFGSQQGSSVALSADGNTAIIGGPHDNSDVGAVWIWTRQGEVWTQQGNKLVAPDAVSVKQQGTSVSLSADGDTALVGGGGAAWVWIRGGGAWTQQSRRLTDPNSAGFLSTGYSVCLSADGNTAIVGASDAVTGGAWIWTRSGGVWTPQSNKLVGSGSVSSSRGAVEAFSVALSADGNTAMVGGIDDNNYRGASWVWTRNAGVWTQQGPKLVGQTGTEQGYSVALSADGNTAIVAAMGSNLVWTRSGQIWTEVGDLAGAQTFGAYGAIAGNQTSAALSADGNTAIVGSPLDNGDVGAAWIWERSGGFWTQQPKLVGSGFEAYAAQGTSVAVSADGNSAVVGGSFDHGEIGAAWVWTRSAGFWTQQSKLVGSDTAGTSVRQGASVAISADGNTAIVGGPYDNNGDGAAWVFTRNAGAWTQQGAKLVGSGVDGFGAEQGVSVSLSADGNTAIVGGYTDGWHGGLGGELPTGTGAAWVWTRSGDTWTQQGPKLVSSDSGPEYYLYSKGQGYSVALAADGNTAIVGSPDDNSAAVWTRNGGVWTRQEPKLAGSGGFSVSLSADGSTAILGSPYDNAASVWTRNGAVWTQQGPRLAASGAIGGAMQGAAVSLSADGNTAVVGGPYDNGHAPYDNGDAGATWIWTRSAGVWTRAQKLVGTGAASAHQGSSVAISFDGSTVFLGGPFDEGDAGAAWVFTATPVSVSPPRQRATRH
ncbi:MAG TPA: WD40 repeat domain-containing protein [Thermoanaerobaculia bacterium]|jgi:lipocalin|nr:WD40 repeat domain-containing protein [Thermoanaerobaculia bacterium]